MFRNIDSPNLKRIKVLHDDYLDCNIKEIPHKLGTSSFLILVHIKTHF